MLLFFSSVSKPFYTSANKNNSQSSTESDFSKITSVDTDQSKSEVSTVDQSLSLDRNQSATQDKSQDQSSNMDMNSLDYVSLESTTELYFCLQL